MQAPRRTKHAAAVPLIARDASPVRYWGIAVVAICAASWAAIVAAAKLLLVVI